MAMREIVVRLSPKMARELDSIALEKKTKRERVLDRLLREALRRESVRRRVLEEFARKQASPEWNKAIKELKRFRARIRRVSEKELERDIQEAIVAVRKQGA